LNPNCLAQNPFAVLFCTANFATVVLISNGKSMKKSSAADPIERKVNRELIRKNYKKIQPYIRRTPVIEVDAADLGLKSPDKITFKLELFQHAGSFKARGRSPIC